MTLRHHIDHLRKRFTEKPQTTLSTQDDWSTIDTTPQGRPQLNHMLKRIMWNQQYLLNQHLKIQQQ